MEAVSFETLRGIAGREPILLVLPVSVTDPNDQSSARGLDSEIAGQLVTRLDGLVRVITFPEDGVAGILGAVDEFRGGLYLSSRCSSTIRYPESRRTCTPWEGES